jgi:hypothetical protein
MAGKNFLARLGAELDVSPITDVVIVVSTYALHTIDVIRMHTKLHRVLYHNRMHVPMA